MSANTAMKTKTLLIAAAALTALTACTDDSITNERVPVTLAYTTLDAVETRAAQNLNEGNFATGENIMVRISNTGASEWTDYTFTTAAEGALTAPNPAPYYPAGTQNIDIVAYYPATAGAEFTVATDQTPDASYKASDLMFASVTNQEKQAQVVELAFSHKMAKLCLNITAGDGVESITSVSILQVKPTVSFNPATGEVGSASGTATTISVSNQGAAVIPAQTITGGLLSIETDKGTATYSVPAGKAFEAGHYYTLNITVNLRAVGATTDITGWIGEGSLTVNPVEKIYEPVGLEFRQTEMFMCVGESEYIIWNTLPTYASRKDVKWIIDNKYVDLYTQEGLDTLVAWVSPEGLVTAKKPGTTKIQAQMENDDGDFHVDCYVTVGEPEYVDLGLSNGRKWAKCNIGATRPEEFGNFYAWGETMTKRAFYWSTYPYCGNPKPNPDLTISDDTLHHEPGSNGLPNLGFYKYNTQEIFSFPLNGVGPDGDTRLFAEDDAATVHWGDDWRMPTTEEWLCLINESTIEEVMENDDIFRLRGLRLTGPNGNSIFLPAAGVYGGTMHSFYYNCGNYPHVEYWSSEIDRDRPYAANVFYFERDYYRLYGQCAVSSRVVYYNPNNPEKTTTIEFIRNQGRPVRAVYVGDPDDDDEEE